MTALTGATLLVLFAANIATVVLGVRNVLTAHVVIGYLLLPPLLFKLSSTGWPIVKYYRGNKRRGARARSCGLSARSSSP